MAFKLADEVVREVWSRNIGMTPLYSKCPSPLFGMWRLYLEQIPDEVCYNFLVAKDLSCNKNQEILLSPEDYISYIEFLRMMGHV